MLLLQVRLLRGTQECGADSGVEQVRDERAEADVGEEVVSHVDAVVAVDKDKDAGDGECDNVPLLAPALQDIRQHRKGELP